jgi:hypothetical protein
MTSRGELGDAARADLDTLLAAALRLAKQHLSEAAEFDPFVLVTASDGRLLGAEIDRSQLEPHPESAELAEAAIAQLVGLASSVRATALTLNARLAKERSDAIEVRLDHRDGASLVVLLPYKRPRFGGRIEYGDTRTFRGAHDIWRYATS